MPVLTQAEKDKIGTNETALANKVDKVAGKGLSANDYDAADKALVASALQTHQDISGKVDKVTGKGLSSNDFTSIEKAKIGANELRLDDLEAPQDHVVIEGVNPQVSLIMDDTSTQGIMDIHDQNTDKTAATIVYDKTNDSLKLAVYNRSTGAVITEFAVDNDGQCYINGSLVHHDGNTPAPPPPVNDYDITRPTVVAPFSTTPTKPELVHAIQDLEYYTNDAMFWGADHDFYLKDVPQNKMILVKYHPNGINVDPGTAGDFFFEKMRLAV